MQRQSKSLPSPTWKCWFHFAVPATRIRRRSCKTHYKFRSSILLPLRKGDSIRGRSGSGATETKRSWLREWDRKRLPQQLTIHGGAWTRSDTDIPSSKSNLISGHQRKCQISCLTNLLDLEETLCLRWLWLKEKRTSAKLSRKSQKKQQG